MDIGGVAVAAAIFLIFLLTLAVVGIGFYYLLAFYDRRAPAPRKKSLAQQLHNVHLMSGTQFEHFLASLFRSLGYRVSVLGGAGDQGVDILLKGGNETIAVQCKNYAKPVGNRPVQQVYAGMGYHGASVGWVVAPAGYTRNAHELARRVGVKLYDEAAIKSWIQKVDALETERAARQQATRTDTQDTTGTDALAKLFSPIKESVLASPARIAVALTLLFLLGLAYIVLTLGPPRTVPDLRNVASIEEAQEIADEAGNFDVVEGSRQDSEEPQGTIISQAPAPGEQVEEESRIYVVVSGRQVAEVPEVVDQTREEAEQTLEEAGFEVGEETRESSESFEGYVIAQDPRGGRTAEVGSTVTITVGGGPKTVEAPDLSNRTVEEARRALEADPDVPTSDVRPSPPAQRSPSSGAVTPTGGSCPPDSPIKGNHSSSGELIYHVPGGQFYDRTNPEECFASEGEAQSAGYRVSQR